MFLTAFLGVFDIGFIARSGSAKRSENTPCSKMYFVNDNDAETNDFDDFDGDRGNGVHDNDMIT